MASTFLAPILIGKKEEVEKVAEESGFNIRGAEIIDPECYEEMDAMAEALYEIRKSKGMTLEQARETCLQANYFGTMLVKWVKRMRFWEALLTQQPTQYVRHFRSSRQNRVKRS